MRYSEACHKLTVHTPRKHLQTDKNSLNQHNGLTTYLTLHYTRTYTQIHARAQVHAHEHIYAHARKSMHIQSRSHKNKRSTVPDRDGVRAREQLDSNKSLLCPEELGINLVQSVSSKVSVAVPICQRNASVFLLEDALSLPQRAQHDARPRSMLRSLLGCTYAAECLAKLPLQKFFRFTPTQALKYNGHTSRGKMTLFNPALSECR